VLNAPRKCSSKAATSDRPATASQRYGRYPSDRVTNLHRVDREWPQPYRLDFRSIVFTRPFDANLIFTPWPIATATRRPHIY